MSKLSSVAFEYTDSLVEKIKEHPFNTELADGTLDSDKFSFYLNQDSIYLNTYSLCQLFIATKVPLEYRANFLSYFEACKKEIESHQNTQNRDNIASTLADEGCTTFQDAQNGDNLPSTWADMSFATFAYTNYIMNTCISEPVEVAVASIFPCFFVYRDVALDMTNHVSEDNIYQSWIDSYSREDFCNAVEEITNIFDVLADRASETVREQMLEAVYNGTLLEWHFWNDSYNQTLINDLL